MPIYRSAGVEVSLITSDLDATISTSASLSKADGPPDLRRIIAALEKSETRLRESPVTDEDSPGPLRFLGARGDAPFFLVQALYPDAQDTGPVQSGPRNPNNGFIKNNLKPDLALVIKVDLTKCSALRQTGEKKNQDIKIEIFYNGELTACRFLAGMRNSDTWSSTAHVQVFSGRRISKQHERPWILASCGSIVLRDEQATGNGVESVWNHVSKALIEEVACRGMNRYGELSPVGDYLKSLASHKPPRLRCEPSSIYTRSPGIIDVVVSLGNGRKDPPTAGHHCEPTRLRDQRYAQQGQTNGAPKAASPEANTKTIETRNFQTPGPTNTTWAGTSVNGEKRPPTVLLRKLAQPQLTFRKPVNISAYGHEGVTSSSTQGGGPATSPTTPAAYPGTPNAEPAPFKEPGTLNWTEPLSDSFRPLEESVAGADPNNKGCEASREKPTRPQGVPRFSLLSSTTPERFRPYDRVGKSWTTPASALANRGVTLQPKGLATPTLTRPSNDTYPPVQAETLPRNETHSGAPISGENIHKLPVLNPLLSSVNQNGAVKTPSRLFDKVTVPARPQKGNDATDGRSKDFWNWVESQKHPTSPSDRTGGRHGSTTSMGLMEVSRSRSESTMSRGPVAHQWQPSELCRNSVFTYAEVDMLRAGQDKDSGNGVNGQVIRQIRKERPGDFKEESILCGVRFVMV
ncbi:hypothetical protein K461DRAFT_110930 [Myriangium duriaei CBS 260.36]|uniref:Uncharacterized protein n=1 Tax=Myriangium duriaei CBS 260.36 TaxID=1168546 RepID=A0A9P4J8B5_9PEZI|nr:hypothetical protein K461DRAFT_110930 [Myriangium duriaei CBS 260.36]